MALLQIFLIIFCLVGLSILLINIRYIFKGEEFRGGCASNSPFLKKEIGECGLCGRKVGEECKMPEVKNA